MQMDLDKKCPFTSEVSIRGRILTGRVVSTKMTRTIIIRRDYLHYVPKYSACSCIIMGAVAEHSLADRYEKRHKNLAAHVSPAFRVELGDVVTVGQCVIRGIPHDGSYRITETVDNFAGQCRPLSKTVRFNVLRVARSKAASKSFGKF
jgi:small subunit ribosomal protein S11e